MCIRDRLADVSARTGGFAKSINLSKESNMAFATSLISANVSAEQTSTVLGKLYSEPVSYTHLDVYKRQVVDILESDIIERVKSLELVEAKEVTEEVENLEEVEETTEENTEVEETTKNSKKSKKA